MAMNRVQFQQGMTQFMAQYGSEAKCRRALFRSRWPQGYRCRACEGRLSSRFRRAGQLYYQCRACRHQTTLVSGTVFEATKLPLTTWFLAIHLLISTKTTNGSPQGTVLESEGGRAATEIDGARWVNVLLSNLKRSIGGAYHAFKQHKYARRYLAEAAYRFNRRFRLPEFVPRLLRAMVLCSPSPEPFLRQATNFSC